MGTKRKRQGRGWEREITEVEVVDSHAAPVSSLSLSRARALPRFLATISLDSGNIAPVRGPNEAAVAQRQAQGRRRCHRRFGQTPRTNMCYGAHMGSPGLSDSMLYGCTHECSPTPAVLAFPLPHLVQSCLSRRLHCTDHATTASKTTDKVYSNDPRRVKTTLTHANEPPDARRPDFGGRGGK